MRAFTGVDLPEEIKKELSKIASQIQMPGVTLVKPEDMHITLHFFSSINELEVGKVIEAVKLLKEDPFEAKAKGLSYFGGNDIRVIFAKIDDKTNGLSNIFNKIGSELDKMQIEYDKKNDFVPHITIARCKFGNTASLKEFIKSHSEHDFASFRVEKVFLRSSVLSEQGPIYNTLCDYKF